MRMIYLSWLHLIVMTSSFKMAVPNVRTPRKQEVDWPTWHGIRCCCLHVSCSNMRCWEELPYVLLGNSQQVDEGQCHTTKPEFLFSFNFFVTWAILYTLCGNIMTKVAYNVSLVNSTPAIYHPRTRDFDGSTKICQMETLNSSNEMMDDTETKLQFQKNPWTWSVAKFLNFKSTVMNIF